MPINLIFLIILFVHSSETKLISLFGIINQGLSTPNTTISDIQNYIEPFLTDNLLPIGLSMNTEIGTILRNKYLNFNNKDYNIFYDDYDISSKVKFYASSSQIDMQGSIGQVMGMFPNTIPRVKMINKTGELSDYLSNFTYFQKTKNFLKSNQNYLNDTNIELFSDNLDVVLNSDKCIEDINLNMNSNLSVLNNNELEKIMDLQKDFPMFFKNYCEKKNCSDFETFNNLDFIEDLFNFIDFIRQFNIKSEAVPNDTYYILLFYHLKKLYFYEQDVFKKSSSPMLRYFNGFLENTKSDQCTNSTLSFVKLGISKPVDILRMLINQSKCKKLILMTAHMKNIVTFIKTLFDYESVFKSNDINIAQNREITSILNPQPAGSFLFEIHQYDNLEFYIRIFYNLEEISNIKNIKLKIPYDEKGIKLDLLVSHMNSFCDETVKYKDSCL